MKRLLIGLVTAVALSMQMLAANVADGVEYYIINDFYGKLLGDSEDGSSPKLSADGRMTNADSYIFVAEKSSSNDYVYLKQKSSGKYLAASGSNNWSVVFEAKKAAEDRYLWSVTTGLKTRITNKKNSGKRLGCDWNNTEFESVFYDKGAGVMNFWSVIPVEGGTKYDYTNVRGTKERDFYTLRGENVTLSDAIDLHIYRESNPLEGGSVNITNERGWVIFDNCTPTNVKNNFLKSIKVNGKNAVDGSNVRIAIYLNGAAVIPCTSNEVALTAYTEANYGGKELTFGNGNHSDLSTDNNSIRSFKLRRGYMATLASGKNGSGYSRVYVADHADVEVKDLPSSLNMRISSIHVKRWQYTSKKGFGGSSNDAYKLRCGWSYNWDANSTSSIDVEYIPILQHRYWPSMSNVNGKEASTATLSINEPEHPEQHEGCSCGGTMNAWTATTITPNFLPAGSRIGSPAPTDQGWLKEYFGHVDDMAYRCDFAVTHGYWGPSDANGTSGWNNRINSIYNDTKRPLWITEWEYGSSWYSDKSIYDGSYKDMAVKTIEILDALETNTHLERYAYYNTDHWKLHCWYDQGGITPLGEAYRYVKSDFAYNAAEQKIPNYWTPGIQTPAVKDVVLSNGKYLISIENGNDDYTNSLKIEAQNASGIWSEVYSEENRWAFDGTTQKYILEPESLTGCKALRVKVTTVSGKSAQSEKYAFQEIDLSEYAELKELKNLSFDNGAFVDAGIRTYKKDISAAAPYSGMQEVEGWTITENGDARASGMFAWGAKHGLGDETSKITASGYDKSNEGGALGIVSVWTASTQYTQKVLLPAGKYKITIPIYNVGGDKQIEKNLFGVVLADGTELFGKNKTYAVGKWSVETIEFSLEGNTPAYLSLGYVAANLGSGSMPHLFVDYVMIEKDGKNIFDEDDNEDGDDDDDDGDDDEGGEDIEDAILSVASSNKPRSIYTIVGTKIDTISKPGLYIVNGKKIVVK